MQLEIGQEVDGYLIQGIIGRGGMGIVYKAEDVALSRQVALKVINPNMSRDEAFVKRFQSEARTLAIINSPHIVAIHAFRKTEQGLFIVMEFVDGGDLSDLLQEGKLSLARTLPIIQQLLRAFQVAHSAGVIHRDIKPPNIMISRSGEVKVTDFGLAKMSQAGATKSITQGVIGTLYYMSPEQIRGEELDHRSDLWSLGVVFYEMLMGARPFDAPYEASVMYAIMNEPLVIPERFQKELPDELLRILGRVLEKDRDLRYADATEMLIDLEEFEAGYVDMTATRVMSGSSSGRKSRPPSGSRTAAKRSPSSTARSHTENQLPATTDSGSGKKKVWLIGGISVTALLAVAAYFIFMGSSAPEPAFLSLNSNPDNASVYVGGDFIGKTPIDGFALDEKVDSIPVRIEYGGFASVDTLLKTRVIHFLELRPDEPIAAESPKNQGAGNQTANRPTASNSGDSQTPAQPAPVLQTGTIVVKSESGGEIFVDGKKIVAGQSHSTNVGMHTITVNSATYGRLETSVNVGTRELKGIEAYFESDVSISTRPSSIVFIDDQPAGETPYFGKLGPGTYKIRVEKDGYMASPSDTTITIAARFDQPLKNRISFTLEPK